MFVSFICPSLTGLSHQLSLECSQSDASNQTFFDCGFCFLNTDHVTTPRGIFSFKVGHFHAPTQSFLLGKRNLLRQRIEFMGLCPFAFPPVFLTVEMRFRPAIRQLNRMSSETLQESQDISSRWVSNRGRVRSMTEPYEICVHELEGAVKIFYSISRIAKRKRVFKK